jgi:hypothetical protein
MIGRRATLELRHVIWKRTGSRLERARRKMQEKRIAQDCEWRSGPTAFLLYFGLFFPYYSPFIFVAEKSSWELSEKS